VGSALVGERVEPFADRLLGSAARIVTLMIDLCNRTGSLETAAARSDTNDNLGNPLAPWLCRVSTGLLDVSARGVRDNSLHSVYVARTGSGP
jgi:hypothetical protein